MTEVLKMKLKSELENVQRVFSEHIDQISRYAPELKKSGDYEDFGTRLATDCLYAFIGTETMCNWYEQYGCNNSHISTLGKTALRNLGVL
jgi:hypothetical protein